MGRRKGGPAPPSAFKPGHPSYLKPGQIPNPDGRPSTFTEEMGERILELIWSGKCKSLYQVEQQDGMPQRRTIYNWTKKYPEFGAALLEARASMAEIYADEIDEVAAGVLNGTVDPAAGNVVIRSKQWKAMVTNPRDYSNKSYVEKNETVKVTTERINRIEIDGLDDAQLDAIEGALQAKLLTGPDGDVYTTGEN